MQLQFDRKLGIISTPKPTATTKIEKKLFMLPHKTVSQGIKVLSSLRMWYIMYTGLFKMGSHYTIDANNKC